MKVHLFVPVTGLVALMAAVGNLVVGLAFWDSRSIAFACALGGVAVVTYGWYTSSGGSTAPVAMMARLAYSIAGGLTVYFSLAWLLWRLGVPVALPFLHDPRGSWIGPTLLIYTGGCYLVMRMSVPDARSAEAGPTVIPENRLDTRPS